MIDIIKKQWIGIVALVFVAFGGLFGGTAVETVVDALGSSEVTTISNPHVFSNTVRLSGGTTISGASTITGAIDASVFTQGGAVLATSTSGTASSFSAADLLTYSVWEVTPNNADLTYTFPASSTLSTLVPTAGDSRTWVIVNATSTAGIDVIFAAGTGSAVKGVGGAALTIDEASHGFLTLTRKANSDLIITTAFPTAD